MKTVRAGVLVLAGIGVALALVSEFRLRHCGSFLIPAGLPYGVEPEWFNGKYTLWDEGGWGIIGDHDEVGFGQWRIGRIAHDEHLYVEIATQTQGPRYVVLDDPEPAKEFPQELLSASEFATRLGSHSRALQWIDVSADACGRGADWTAFLYRIYLNLVAVPMGTVVALRAIVRAWRQPRSGAA